MYPSRATRIIALLLALLHLAVGATGEALHYFTCDLLISDSPAQEQPVGHYGHFHGPDFHWHVHEFEIETTADERAESLDDRHSGYRQSPAPHDPHACPALALVDKVREAAGSMSIDLVQDDTLAFLHLAEQASRCFDSRSLHLARGPPA